MGCASPSSNTRAVWAAFDISVPKADIAWLTAIVPEAKASITKSSKRVLMNPTPSSCVNSCILAGGDFDLTSDGICDDGGPGAEYSDCAACSDCTDCGPRDCEPAPFELTVGPLRQGATATFRLIGGQPSAKSTVVYSLKGLGSKNVPWLDVTLGLEQPRQFEIARANADGDGVTEWSVTVPAEAPVGPVFFQAVTYGSVSNVVEAEILPSFLPTG